MALDPDHHRTLLSCEESNLMTVFDLDPHLPIAYRRWHRTRMSSNLIRFKP